MILVDVGIFSTEIGGDISALSSPKDHTICTNPACGDTTNTSCHNTDNRCMGSTNTSCTGTDSPNACS